MTYVLIQIACMIAVFKHPFQNTTFGGFLNVFLIAVQIYMFYLVMR
ncbi:hypothetical protein VPHD137_0035 [Vibrio phage D137]